MCDPLNPFVMGGRLFSSMEIVSDPSQKFSLLGHINQIGTL